VRPHLLQKRSRKVVFAKPHLTEAVQSACGRRRGRAPAPCQLLAVHPGPLLDVDERAAEELFRHKVLKK
jgi:hypothetical protein